MRKTITASETGEPSGGTDGKWLNIERIASIEVTSEEQSFPIENALTSNGTVGWRASQGGEQVIRIIFDEPASIRRIHLVFHETEVQRSQEFVIRWRPSSGGPATEVVRQQWNFSPRGSTVEIEDYSVDLNAASSIEIVIRPDVGHPEAVASLASLRLG